MAVIDLADGVTNYECCAHRAFRVVAVRERRAEQTHDGVADELLDDTSERLDLQPDSLVVRRQERLHLFRVETLADGVYGLRLP